MNLNGKLANGRKVSIEIEDGKIKSINDDQSASDNFIIPGFIETHSHGGYDFDWIHNNKEGALIFLNKIALNEGTTSIVGTTITTNKEIVVNALKAHGDLVNKKINGANLIGYHIEGPFINPLKKGAHPVEKMIKPSINNIKEFLEENYNLMRLITIAPELSDLETIKRLHNDNVIVFTGHSVATAEEAKESDGITHFNNAMIKYGTENDSLAKEAIKNNEWYIEFINDGIHNSLELAKEIYKLKPKDKLILITDSLHIKGLPDGQYPGPNWTIIKKDGAAWTPEGILNGSVYTQLEAFKDWITKVGASMEEAIMATSTNAATLLGLNKGKIEEGYDADILVLNNDLDLLETYINGRKIIKEK